MKFGQGMARDDPKVDLEGQGHQVRNCYFRSHCSITGNEIKVKVTWVKVKGILG